MNAREHSEVWLEAAERLMQYHLRLPEDYAFRDGIFAAQNLAAEVGAAYKTKADKDDAAKCEKPFGPPGTFVYKSYL